MTKLKLLRRLLMMAPTVVGLYASGANGAWTLGTLFTVLFYFQCADVLRWTCQLLEDDRRDVQHR